VRLVATRQASCHCSQARSGPSETQRPDRDSTRAHGSCIWTSLGAGEAAIVFGGGFLAEDQVEEVGVAELGVVGALDQGGRGGGEVGQAEPGGVRADPGGDKLPMVCSFR